MTPDDGSFFFFPLYLTFQSDRIHPAGQRPNSRLAHKTRAVFNYPHGIYLVEVVRVEPRNREWHMYDILAKPHYPTLLYRSRAPVQSVQYILIERHSYANVQM